MTQDFFATKRSMSQAWTTQGKRLAVTKLVATPLAVIRQFPQPEENKTIKLEIGYGRKKQKNMTKPLRQQIKRGGFDFGVKKMKAIVWQADDEQTAPKVGELVNVSQVLSVGDVVDVQGQIKGRGFAGGVKRYGFSGGPKTHGQSDRHRAVGSIGSGTTPGRVWKGKRMPGHYGGETVTVGGLVVLHLDPETNEVWLNGPVPGAFNSDVRLHKTGKTRKIELDRVASGLPEEESAPVDQEQKSDVVEQPTDEEVAATEATDQPTEKSEEKTE